ncbi:MAG: hypothetical protein E7171_00445 [Firmicutes bacterium]|nr:hypothetical protein [Bacillota bacterium]
MSILNWLFNKKKKEKKDIEIRDIDSSVELDVKLDKNEIISLDKDENHNASEKKLDKLNEEESSLEWLDDYQNFFKPRDEKLYDLSIQASKTDNIENEIKLLKKFVSYFEAYQNECKIKGKSYEKYFYDMHIQGSSKKGKPDYYWLNERKERLNYLEGNRDKLIEEKRFKEEALKDLPQKLKNIIRNNPGILQSEIYKEFDKILKDEISSQLYFWAKDGKIKREKSGNTYKIYYK